MRKLTLFLIVFGLGLVALVLVDRASRGPKREERGGGTRVEQPRGPSTGEDPGEDPGPGPGQPADPRLGQAGDERPPRVEPPADHEGVHVQLEGPLSFTSFGESGTKSYTFDSKRVEPLGNDAYDAHDLVIEAFDPGTAQRRVTVRAGRGRLRIESRPGGGIGVADDGQVQLFDVVVTQHTGGPLVPLVFRAAELVGRFELEAFETPGETEGIIEGVGLSGRGRGLRFDGRGGEFNLLHGGSVVFSTESGRPLRFSTPRNGPLRIRRIDDEHLEINASEGVEFGLETDPEGRVTAREARLFARIEDEEVLLERATVSGDVVAMRGTDRFAGDRARLAFGPENELREVDLEGSPEWQLTIESAEQGRVAVEGEGEGPLAVDWLGSLVFEMQGESEFRVPSRDLVVRAAQRMGGSLGLDGDSGDFRASGSVRLLHAGWRVTTEELSTELLADGTMQAVGRGLTRLAGTDGEGQPLELTAGGGIELVGLDEDWRVELARDVELVTTGENAARTRAGLVRDLDWSQVVFQAERGVTYSSPLGNGEAGRLEARGRTEFDLFGTSEEPARFRVTPPPSGRDERPNVGDFEALEIDVREKSVDARGEVSATLGAGGRTHRLESEGLRVDIEPQPDGESTFTAVGRAVRRASVREEGLDVILSGDELVIHGTWRGGTADEVREIEASDAVATGRVAVEYFGEFEVGAAGHRFTLARDGSGRIDAGEDGRVSAWGRFPESELPYELNADWVEFDDERVRAPAPRVFVDARLLALGDPLASGPSFTRAEADWLVADRDGVLLTGSVEVAGVDGDGRGIQMEANMLRLLASAQALEEGEDWQGVVERFEAWGDFRATYQGNAVVYAEYCLASPERLLLEGTPARVDVLGLALESAQIEIDMINFLVTSERGILRSAQDRGEWSIEFASVRPVVDGDETMIALLAPVYTTPTAGARADWAVMWLDSEEWRTTGRERIWGEPSPAVDQPAAPPLPERDLVPNVFRQLNRGDLSSFMRALYLEGEAEVTENGAREARADAVFIDMARNQAWLRGAELIPSVEMGDRVERLRTRAEEVHTASDGTLRAARASLSACSHEVPHYRVETGELVLEPRENGSWRVSARKNRLLFAGGLQVPIPSIGRAVLDPGGDLVGFENESGELITFDRLVFGRTARFGTAVATAFQRDIGKVGKAVGSAVGFTTNVKGKWDYEVGWLSSRGPLGRVGLLLSEKKRRGEGEEEFWLNLYASVVPDSGTDRGLIRVPEEERTDLRQWYNARGRYPVSDEEWFDLAFTRQSDAAVQSEFFENEFLDYEERDNYLHWRKASSTNYVEAAASVRVEDFRTMVEELPSAGVYHGATPLGHVGGQPILWEGTLDLAYLRRREADPADTPQVFADGLGVVFADGFGDREVVRVDNTYRVAVPVPLGSGLRATPFLDAALTAWDRGESTTDHPTRVGLFGGTELSASYWKLRDSGFVHEVAPTASFRSDLVLEESGGQPVTFDSRDLPLDGKEVAVGVRQRWWRPGEPRRFDLDVVARQVYDRADDRRDIREVALLGGLETDIRETPFKFLYDVRFDVEDSTTTFSRTTVGSRPTESLAVEVSHDRGLDELGEQLYEAATVAGRYRFSPKWELEARQTISFLDDGSLSNEFTLRRFSHDFLLEVRVGHRAGEGTSFSFNLAPLLAWKRRGLGRLGF